MAKARLLVLLLVTFVSSFLLALQPPVPRLITVPPLSPAAYRQEEPGLAWDGQNFVAVWTDQRRTANWRYGFLPSIYGSRLSAEGAVLDPVGIELVARGVGPRIASNENGSLMVYRDGNVSSFALPLGRDARPAGKAINLGSLDARGLASNGLTYCVVAHRWPDTNKALILNANGDVIQTYDIAGEAWAVAAIEGRYLVVSVRGREIVATTIVANRPAASRVIATADTDQSAAVALTGGNRVLVSWLGAGIETHSYDYLILDANANQAGVLHGPRRVGGVPSNIGAPLPSLAWDGELFLLSWGEGSLSAVRVRQDGSILRNAEISLDPRIQALASVSGGGQPVLLTIESEEYTTDIFLRKIDSFRNLETLPERSVVALSARPQMQPAVAYGANNVALAVSIEGSGPDSITATLFSPHGSRPALTREIKGKDFFVQKEGVSVAALGETFLVSWREMAQFSTSIVAQRVAADGTLIGGPISIAHEDGFVYFGETSIATDGASFLVAWDSPTKEILVRRLSADGTLLDPDPLVVSRNPGKATHELGHPEALWTGSEYLVAWSEHEFYSAAPPAGISRIRGARVTALGALVDTSESHTYVAQPGHPTGVDLAKNGDGLMLVASFSSEILPALKSVVALPLNRAGYATQLEPLRLDLKPDGARLESPTVAGAGKSFVALWTEQQRNALDARVRGARISANGEVERFDVVDADAFSPAATSTGNEIVLVHSQHDAVGSNVVRLFSTTFSPEPQKRQRTVRP